MKPGLFASAGLLALFAVPQVCAGESELAVCRSDELLGYAPEAEEIEAHRQFALPTLAYPFGTQLESYDGGFKITLRIDERGQVVCYRIDEALGQTTELSDERQKVIGELRTWRYLPFVRDEEAAAAIVTEIVAEQEAPQAKLQPPDVPLDEVEIALSRSGCYGPCPSYSVTLHGSGRAVYTGRGFVDVEGEHHYSVSPGVIARLVSSLRSKGLWSLRPSYRARITDSPTYDITMRLGDQTHTIEDYVGRAVGMPAAVTEFEKEIDAAAQSDDWVHLSRAALARLKAEGFAFASSEGGALLARAVANATSHDDAVAIELIQLGAPIDIPVEGAYDEPGSRSLLETALANGREQLVAALLERGALATDGPSAQQQLDDAFRAAIAGGRLSLVQQVWNAAPGSHPRLTFADREDDEGAVKQSPVTLLLSKPYRSASPWQGREIAEWLMRMGCDMNAHRANGETLLHIAAEANDAAFVRFLLDEGMDPSTRGEFGLRAIGSTHSEDVAMLLLEADTELSSDGDDLYDFREFAEHNHWQRVIAWLDAHSFRK